MIFFGTACNKQGDQQSSSQVKIDNSNESSDGTTQFRKFIYADYKVEDYSSDCSGKKVVVKYYADRSNRKSYQVFTTPIGRKEYCKNGKYFELDKIR